jgi:hypothetical protein
MGSAVGRSRGGSAAVHNSFTTTPDTRKSPAPPRAQRPQSRSTCAVGVAVVSVCRSQGFQGHRCARRDVTAHHLAEAIRGSWIVKVEPRPTSQRRVRDAWNRRPDAHERQQHVFGAARGRGANVSSEPLTWPIFSALLKYDGKPQPKNQPRTSRYSQAAGCVRRGPRPAARRVLPLSASQDRGSVWCQSWNGAANQPRFRQRKRRRPCGLLAHLEAHPVGSSISSNEALPPRSQRGRFRRLRRCRSARRLS